MAEDTKRQISQRRHRDSITPEFRQNEYIKYCTHCWYCGQELYWYSGDRNKHHDFATKDHLIPYSQGGRGAKNLVPACMWCNQHKRNRTLEEYRFQRFGPLGGSFWAEKHERNYYRRGDPVHRSESFVVSKNSSSLQRTVDTDTGRVEETERQNLEVR